MHDIIVRFPSKEMADYFCGQMSDGYGEGFCNFTRWTRKCDTDGKRPEDYEETFEEEKQVYFVTYVEDFMND